MHGTPPALHGPRLSEPDAQHDSGADRHQPVTAHDRALALVAGRIDLGWIRCQIPYEGSGIPRIDGLGFQAYDGVATSGLVHDEEGASVVEVAAVDAALGLACDAALGDEPYERCRRLEGRMTQHTGGGDGQVLGTVRWTGASPGQRGRCRFEAPRYAPIVGVVLDVEEAPVRDVVVRGPAGKATSDADGRFELRGLVGAPARLLVAQPVGPRNSIGEPTGYLMGQASIPSLPRAGVADVEIAVRKDTILRDLFDDEPINQWHVEQLNQLLSEDLDPDVRARVEQWTAIQAQALETLERLEADGHPLAVPPVDMEPR